MSTKPLSVDGLFAAVKDAERRRDEADAELKSLRPLLEAANLLRSHGVDLGAKAMTATLPPPAHSGVEAAKVGSRDAQVRQAIADLGRDVFTVPDLVKVCTVSNRSIKRAIDDMVTRREVEIVEPGYKRKATRYKLLSGDEEAEENRL